MLSSSGTIKCWGLDNLTGFGVNWGTYTAITFPALVPGLSNVTQITAGIAHTCALIGDGTVKCWGENYYGQLGDGTNTERLAPVAVAGLSGVTRLAAGTFTPVRC